MGKYGFFIDLSRCIACRGCQVACKQWNELPAETTINRGTHQNPEDLSAQTWTLIRWTEKVAGNELKWLFFKDQCRHCLDPLCQMTAADEEAIYTDQATGAVIFTDKTARLNFDEVRDACPYNIPRQDPKSRVISKCTMCVDRVQEGMPPACVKACPTGAMNHGLLEEMQALAKQRLEIVKKKYPDAMLSGMEDTSTIHLLIDTADNYDLTVMTIGEPAMVARRNMFRALRSGKRRTVVTTRKTFA